MDNDDDDFEYDDDFDYDIGSGSDNDDENIRQEIELDDIKSRLHHDSSHARSQLESLASCYTSSVCVDAALQLLRLEGSPEKFITLARTIANAPESVEDYARCGAFNDAARLLDHDASLHGEDLVATYISTLSILSKLKPSRVYATAALKLADVYLSLGDLDAACRVLDNDLEPSLSLMNELSAPPFKFESIILRIKLCMAASTVKREELRLLVDSAFQVHQGARSVSGTIILQQTQGLLKIERGMLDEARVLLTESFKGQSEADIVEQDKKGPNSALFMLILVATAVGAGNFDPSLEIPLIAGVSAEDESLKLPLDIAAAFKNRNTESFVSRLKLLEKVFYDAQWRLGQLDILCALKTSFSALQFTHTLLPYSRVKWDTIQQRFGSQLNVKESDFTSLVLDNKLSGTFKLNKIDRTIDRLPATSSDWRRKSTRSLGSTPLPKRYTEHAAKEDQKIREDMILSKWKRGSTLRPDGLFTNQQTVNYEPRSAVHDMLANTLRNHFDAMDQP